MNTLTLAYIFMALAIVVTVILLVPKTRKSFSELIDRLIASSNDIGKSQKEVVIPSSFGKPQEQTNSKESKKGDSLQDLLVALNEQKPMKKEEMKAIVLDIFGKNISPNIRPDYDAVDQSLWMIQFPLSSASGVTNIMVSQTKDGIWVKKEKSY